MPGKGSMVEMCWLNYIEDRGVDCRVCCVHGCFTEGQWGEQSLWHTFTGKSKARKEQWPQVFYWLYHSGVVEEVHGSGEARANVDVCLA
jgi:hypothetical protein